MIIKNDLINTIYELKDYINNLLQEKEEDEELFLDFVELIQEYNLDDKELKVVTKTLYRFFSKTHDVELTKNFLYIS